MTSLDTRLAELRALAEPTRLRLVAALLRGELTVSELTQVVEQSQPGVSRHLRLLTEAGLVARHQEGAWAFYRATVPAALLPALDGLVGGTAAADLARLGAVLEARSAAARAYFAEAAAGWDDLRRRYLAEEAIEAAMLRAAREAGPIGELIDLGTGTARMLVLLDGLYERAVGFDASPEMLAIARLRLAEAGVTRGYVRRADLAELTSEGAGADLVLLHHVLHFLGDPAGAVARAVHLARPGGRVVVADLAPHDREELREHHAHRRLGFDTATIAGWGAEAGATLLRAETIPAATQQGLPSHVWVLERGGAAERPGPQRELVHAH